MAAKVTGTSSTARKRAASGPAVPVTGADEPQDRIVLAVIDGIECTADRVIPFGVCLDHLETVLRLKPVYAELRLVERVVGRDTLDKLKASTMTKQEWRALVTAVVEHVSGPVEQEATQGN